MKEKWYTWKVRAINNTIEYEDIRGSFMVQGIKDYDGYYTFYIRTVSENPIFRGAVVSVELMEVLNEGKDLEAW